MATVILTAVGTVLGGPIGGAIGALVGQAIDQNVLFKPKGREGPRLNELQVQTSTYGSQIPKIFGTMRVAGTVIWATDLRETRVKSGGGKGRPSTTTYSYSASFAVALSSRTVQSVGRIWADGNLLRGAAGDYKTELGALRLHHGGPDQAADPLIASAQGIGVTPAHRGIAYAVFEDLQLADYGNRIPSLTFEVVADTDEVTVDSIARALTQDGVVSESAAQLGGYAANGGNVAAALAPLIDAYGLRVRTDGLGVTLDDGLESAGVLDAVNALTRLNGRDVVPVRQVRDPAETVPRVYAIRHHDFARDYQVGLQKAVRSGTGRREVQVDVPAVLSATQARAMAERQMAAAWKARHRIEMICGWSALLLPSGCVVAVTGQSGLWCVTDSEWLAMGVTLSLQHLAVGAVPTGEAFSGTAQVAADHIHGPTQLVLADLPGLGDAVASAPVVVAAAAGASPGWRRAMLFTVAPEGGEAEAIGQSAPRATIGTITVPPGEGVQPDMIDRVNVIHVTLLAPDMVLSPADDAALARGANLCLVGRELIQFGSVTQVGPADYILRHLLRGRRGTEWAMAGHAAGERLVILDPDTLIAVPDTAVRVGDTLGVLAVGVGDSVPASASLSVTGEALRPPSPVHARITSDGSGGWDMRWTRRSRAGWRWMDGIDAPLGEEQEAYIVRVYNGGTLVRQAETAVPAWTYTAAMLAADGAAGTAIDIFQAGSSGISRPRRIMLPA